MPEKVFVDIELLLPKQLEKDLMEHQWVCTTCKGLGLVIRDNVYGLKEERPQPWIIGFPYKNQSLFPCPDCYNGVQPVCKFCGAPGSRMYIHAETNCQCQGASDARSQKRFQEYEERWAKAEKISIEEANQRFAMVFIDGPDEYVSPEDLAERLDELKDDDPELETPYVWGTYTTSFMLRDAADLVVDACEELHEEAETNISQEDINRLQEFLTQWSGEVKSGTDTYWPDYKIGIIADQ
jgi:hypothetical protein